MASELCNRPRGVILCSVKRWRRRRSHGGDASGQPVMLTSATYPLRRHDRRSGRSSRAVVAVAITDPYSAVRPARSTTDQIGRPSAHSTHSGRGATQLSPRVGVAFPCCAAGIGRSSAFLSRDDSGNVRLMRGTGPSAGPCTRASERARCAVVSLAPCW